MRKILTPALTPPCEQDPSSEEEGEREEADHGHHAEKNPKKPRSDFPVFPSTISKWLRSSKVKVIPTHPPMPPFKYSSPGGCSRYSILGTAGPGPARGRVCVLCVCVVYISVILAGSCLSFQGVYDDPEFWKNPDSSIFIA